jgi:hypothetical protein
MRRGGCASSPSMGTFAGGGASMLVTTDVASAPAFGRRVIGLAAFVAYVDAALR